jgi:RNA polymerase sigma factor (sigma-70 family)
MQELYTQYKGLLLKLAYQLTGSFSDAEDAVQDVFLKIYDVKPASFVQPKAYLCKMVTNRCLDILKSARKKREQYFGPWLPEPILTPNDPLLESVVQNELLSYGVLVLLEKLSPAERTVFVLREAFGFEYSVIAKIVEKNETNCRKLLSRARKKMGILPDEPFDNELVSEEWIRRLLSALENGHVDTVVSLLSADVISISDGGGKKTAAVHPIQTAENVARFLLGLFQQIPAFGRALQIEIMPINGQIGLVVHSQGSIETVMLMQVKNKLIHRLYFIRNPDKLNLPSLR